tara:strand:+ start:2674 stop:2865 length:192 start_codon:yes stop_codon:yes gene_type:complete
MMLRNRKKLEKELVEVLWWAALSVAPSAFLVVLLALHSALVCAVFPILVTLNMHIHPQCHSRM